jgi:hypothetical protein
MYKIKEQAASVICVQLTFQEQLMSVSYYNSPTDGIIEIYNPAF